MVILNNIHKLVIFPLLKRCIHGDMTTGYFKIVRNHDRGNFQFVRNFSNTRPQRELIRTASDVVNALMAA